jgi:hypothetical protein
VNKPILIDIAAEDSPSVIHCWNKLDQSADAIGITQLIEFSHLKSCDNEGHQLEHSFCPE